MSNPFGNIDGLGSGSVSESYESYLKTYRKIDNEYSQMTASVFGDIDPKEIARMIKAEKDEKAKAAFMQELPGMIGTGLSAAASIFGAIKMNQVARPSAAQQKSEVDYSTKTDAELNSSLSANNEKIAALEGERDAAATAWSKAKQDQKAADEKYNNAHTEKNEHYAAARKAEDEACVLQKTLDTLVVPGGTHKLVGELNTLNGELDGLNEDLRTLNAQLEEVQGQEQAANIPTIMANISAKESQIAAKKREIEAKNNEIETEQNRLTGEIEAKNRTKEEQDRLADKDMEDAYNATNKACGEVTKQAGIKQKKQSEIDALKAENERIQAEINKRRSKPASDKK